MWVRKTIIGHSLNIHRISNVIYIYFVRQFSMSAVYTRFVAWIQNDWRFRGSRNMAECGRLSESRQYGRRTHRLFWLCIYAIVQLRCFFSSFRRRRLLVVSFVIESNISSFIFSALPLQQRNHSRRATEKKPKHLKNSSLSFNDDLYTLKVLWCNEWKLNHINNLFIFVTLLSKELESFEQGQRREKIIPETNVINHRNNICNHFFSKSKSQRKKKAEIILVFMAIA